MKSAAGILFVIFGLIQCWEAGAEDKMTIKQLNNVSNMVAIQNEGTGVYQINDELLATDADGRQCPLKVVAIKEKILIANSSQCNFKNNLKLGQKLEKSLFSGFNVPVKREENSNNDEEEDVAIILDEKDDENLPAPVPVVQIPFEQKKFENVVGSLTFFNPKNRFVYTGIGYAKEIGSKSTATTKYASNNAMDKYEVGTNALESSLSYGVTDNGAFGVNMNIVFVQETKNSSCSIPGASCVLDNKKANDGVTNPELFVLVRALDQNQEDVNFDVKVAWQINAQQAKRGNAYDEDDNANNGNEFSTKAGNVASGRHEFTVLPTISRSINKFEVKGTFHFQVNSEAKYSIKNANSLEEDKDLEVTEAGHTIFGFGVEGAFRIKRNILQLGMGVGFLPEIVSTYSILNTRITETKDPQKQYIFKMLSKHMFSNNFLFGLGYEYSSLSDADILVTADGQSATIRITKENISANKVFMQVDVMF